jgi:hypothetical protein
MSIEKGVTFLMTVNNMLVCQNWPEIQRNLEVILELSLTQKRI